MPNISDGGAARVGHGGDSQAGGEKGGIVIDEAAKAILKRALSDSTPEEIENLRFHLKNETPVLCGDRFRYLDFVAHGAG